MSNFASLKKSSADIGRLTKEIEKINTPQGSNDREADTRFWTLTRDKAGNGSAVIRFLPAAAVDGDDALPWVRYFDHGFKGPSGKWYIENSLTTIGQKDPVSEYNSSLWNASNDDASWQRKQARDQKRRLHYIANIMVIKDQSNPENEGKIFLFKFGKKIFDKITLAMNPQYPDDPAMNPFDLWNGANFKLRTRMVAGYINYDQSTFESPSALSDDDAQLEKTWKSEYSLKEFVDPKNFKPYDELKKRLTEVLGDSVSTMAASVKPSKVADTSEEDVPFKAAAQRKSVTAEEEDEDLNYFKGLAEDA
jgi:hypothetical protein